MIFYMQKHCTAATLGLSTVELLFPFPIGASARQSAQTLVKLQMNMSVLVR